MTNKEQIENDIEFSDEELKETYFDSFTPALDALKKGEIRIIDNDNSKEKR